MQCIRCEKLTHLHADALGHLWCDECEEKYQLIQWGIAHDFSPLECPPYAIADGYEYWMIVVLIGMDDFVHTALQTVLDLERKAS